MTPECSASGMNTSGDTRPSCGWRHRTSASAPPWQDGRSSDDLGLAGRTLDEIKSYVQTGMTTG